MKKLLNLSFPLKLILMVVIVFIASIGIFRQQLETPPPTPDHVDSQSPAERPAAPAIAAKNLAGTMQEFNDLTGQVTIVAFWATWCAPCLVELPTFEKLIRHFDDKRLNILAINVDGATTDKKSIVEFWKNTQLSFPTLIDPDLKVAQAYAVDTIPANFVVDLAGNIAMSSSGANDWSSDKIKKIIFDLLEEKP